MNSITHHIAMCFACDIANKKNMVLFCAVVEDGSLHEMHRHFITNEPNDFGIIAAKIEMVKKMKLKTVVIMPGNLVAYYPPKSSPESPVQIEDAQAR